MRGTCVFAIASAKGGVGKTTTSINLGAALADADLSVIVVEMDLVMANMVDFIDIDIQRGATLHEVLAGRASVEEAIYDAPGGIDVIPSGIDLETYAETDPGLLKGVVEELRSLYDVVILDTGAGVSQETLLPLGIADDAILVSSPRLASVRDTRKTMELSNRVGGSVAGIVFVKSGTGMAPDPPRIADFLSADLLGHVPEDGAVPDSQDVGRPVTEFDPSSQAAQAYRRAASELLDHIRERIRDSGERTLGDSPREPSARGSPDGDRDGKGNAKGDGNGNRNGNGNGYGNRNSGRGRDGSDRSAAGGSGRQREETPQTDQDRERRERRQRERNRDWDGTLRERS